MDMDAVLLVDGVGIQLLIVHVVVVLITEYKVNFEKKFYKTNLFLGVFMKCGNHEFRGLFLV